MNKKLEIEFCGRNFSIESGHVAKQTSGAVLVRYGDTVVLTTVVADRKKAENPEIGFIPLTVDYREKTYAAGRIPGGFIKREGRPSDGEILISRLIDRPIRPLISKEFLYETYIVVNVLSADSDNNPDILSIIGSSAALSISDIPFKGPVAGVRVGRNNGKYICNPKLLEMEQSDIDLVIAGTKEGVVMVEGGGNNISNEDILEAIMFGYDSLKPLLDLQEQLKEIIGVPKRVLPETPIDSELVKKVEEIAKDKLEDAFNIYGKIERNRQIESIYETVLETLKNDYPEKEKDIIKILSELEYNIMRDLVTKKRKRIGGRAFDEIRPIICEVGILPRTHGSALFTRGETQALVVTTLGTSSDEQIVEDLKGEISKKFMLHYNFPPFSVGEARPMRAPGRREIGHGALAERALEKVLPDSESFPYTIRVVSDILESNGSSSMATVCGATLSLMDAGVPIKAPVAGIAMGLMKNEDEIIILSDILGDEDRLGDMDFKVAGTYNGITALQMDIKIPGGINYEILKRALKQATDGIVKILDIMTDTIPAPREDLSIFAPRIITIKIQPEKIKDVIGPGGKSIKKIVDETGVKINIEDDGRVSISAVNEESAKKALKIIREITEEAEIGKIYTGRVTKITDFGAFVEILPGTEGLIPISHIAKERVRRVSDILKENEEVQVKVVDIDKQGKIRLSRKDALK